MERGSNSSQGSHALKLSDKSSIFEFSDFGSKTDFSFLLVLIMFNHSSQKDNITLLIGYAKLSEKAD